MVNEPESSAAAAAPVKPARRPGALVGAALLGGIAVLFAVLNSQSVEMHWIVASTRTPLIALIALFMLIGFVGGYIAASHRRSDQA